MDPTRREGKKRETLFAIRRLRRSPLVTMDETTYLRARDGHRLLMAALAFEEKLDFVLDNYIEYENEILGRALNYTLRPLPPAGDVTRQEIHTIGRRLANLLASARMYIDQVKHDLSALLGSASETIVGAFCAEYDARLEYRFMEALRNHVCTEASR